MSAADSFDHITDQTALLALCERLANVPWVALDTEFMREKTYYPQLCLLQLATPDWAVCVDPLADIDLTPLLLTLYRTDMTKVFHAAGQDLEIFFNLHGSIPVPLFDTQLAAPLLGYADQIGYGNLVEDVLGARLEKAHTRADWSRRPLEHDQLRYAADDVIYLAQLYPVLIERLNSRGRLAWLASEFDSLADAQRYEMAPDSAWMRVKAADRLRGPQLSVLQGLAAWREQTARDSDRPRGWLLRDDVMLDIARHRPADRKGLGRIRGLHEATLKQYGDALLAVVGEAGQRQPQKLSSAGRPEKPSPSQDAVVDVLMAHVRVRALQESLSPAALGSRKDIVRLVLGDRTTPLLQGWRGAMIGDELKRLLDGELCLRVVAGEVQVLP